MSYNILHYINIGLLFPITLCCRLLLCIGICTIIHRILVRKKKLKNVAIVVLGDIGRSPRMQYHALSFAENGFNVNIVGLPGSKPLDEIIDCPNITVNFLYQERLSTLFPKIIAYFVKVIMQSVILLITMIINLPACEYVLVQNPPCIPSLFCCYVMSLWNGAWFVIDWHNYGYTILGLSLGENHKLVKIAHRYERAFGHLSSANLCVTRAMQKDLHDNWNITATVVYDRPPHIFKPITVEDQHKVLKKLALEYPVLNSGSDDDCTIFTKLNDNLKVLKSLNRPAFIISSTSWTEDEDFSIMLLALDEYDEKAGKENLPNLICAITGKGPMKSYYLKEIAKRNWKRVKVFTPWLEPSDYPKLIACADLGICLHTSSSGLDLPMKVVDMFGCEVPVAAIHFNCLDELLQDGYNGVVFKNSKELCDKLCALLKDFSNNQSKLKYLKGNLSTFSKSSWSKNWNENVFPIFKSCH